MIFEFLVRFAFVFIVQARKIHRCAYVNLRTQIVALLTIVIPIITGKRRDSWSDRRSWSDGRGWGDRRSSRRVVGDTNCRTALEEKVSVLLRFEGFGALAALIFRNVCCGGD